MHTLTCYIDPRPAPATHERHIVESRHKKEVTLAVGMRIVGATLWIAAWVVGLGYFIGWLGS